MSNGSIIEGMISEAKRKFQDEEIQRRRLRMTRRQVVLDRINVAAETYVRGAQDEGDMRSRLDKIRDVVDYVSSGRVRVSMAEALADLVERGRWSFRPFFWKIEEKTTVGTTRRVLWRGYVQNNRIHRCFFVSDDFMDISQSQDEDHRLLIHLKAVEKCSGGFIASVYSDYNFGHDIGESSPEEGIIIAMAVAYIGVASKLSKQMTNGATTELTADDACRIMTIVLDSYSDVVEGTDGEDDDQEKDGEI
jgi:hypothetical protein